MKIASRLVSFAACLALATSFFVAPATAVVSQTSTSTANAATSATAPRTISLAARCQQLQRTWKKKSRHMSAKKRKALKKKLTATCRAAKKAAAAKASAPKPPPTIPLVPTLPVTPPNPVDDQNRVMCRINDPRLPEVSGLVSSQSHPTTLWTHNDSGDSARIFALNAETCSIQAQITLSGVTARDFEAIGRGTDAAGSSVLWIADIGDNSATRASVTLYRIPEPATLTDQVVTPEAVTVTYADGARNAEGILVSPEPAGPVWIVSKEAVGGIYQLTAGFQQSGSAVATRIADVPSYLTDAALDFDGAGIVLRRGNFGQTRQGSVPGADPRSFTFPSQPQGEAVTFSADSHYLFIASEGAADLIRIPVSRIP